MDVISFFPPFPIVVHEFIFNVLRLAFGSSSGGFRRRAQRTEPGASCRRSARRLKIAGSLSARRDHANDPQPAVSPPARTAPRGPPRGGAGGGWGVEDGVRPPPQLLSSIGGFVQFWGE